MKNINSEYYFNLLSQYLNNESYNHQPNLSYTHMKQFMDAHSVPFDKNIYNKNIDYIVTQMKANNYDYTLLESGENFKWTPNSLKQAATDIVYYESLNDNYITIETAQDILKNSAKRSDYFRTAIKSFTTDDRLSTCSEMILLGRITSAIIENTNQDTTGVKQKLKSLNKEIDKAEIALKEASISSSWEYGDDFEYYPLNLANSIADAAGEYLQKDRNEIFEMIKDKEGIEKLLDTMATEMDMLNQRNKLFPNKFVYEADYQTISTVIRQLCRLQHPEIKHPNIPPVEQSVTFENTSKTDNKIQQNNDKRSDKVKNPYKYKATYWITTKDKTDNIQAPALYGNTIRSIQTQIEKKASELNNNQFINSYTLHEYNKNEEKYTLKEKGLDPQTHEKKEAKNIAEKHIMTILKHKVGGRAVVGGKQETTLYGTSEKHLESKVREFNKSHPKLDNVRTYIVMEKNAETGKYDINLGKRTLSQEKDKSTRSNKGKER